MKYEVSQCGTKTDDTSITLASQTAELELLHELVHGERTASCQKLHVLTGETALEPDVQVCLDDVSPPCNVLSFGIADNWIFDDFMLSYGCRVWSFDPSMDKINHQRHENHRFFHVGIGTKDGVHKDTGQSTLYGGGTQFNVKTLQTIMREMDITQVDVLRLDVESAEWGVLDSWAATGQLANIKQLLTEIHMFTRVSQLQTLRVLQQQMGVFFADRNKIENVVVWKDLTQCYEVGFLAARMR
jgi:hypothetical protein